MDLAMVSSETALNAPRSPDAPQPLDGGFWDETQWAVFMAFMDTIVPAVVPKSLLADKESQLGIPDVQYSAVAETAQDTAVEKRDEGSIKAFLEDRPSTNLLVRATMVHLIARLSPVQRDKLGAFLSRLSSSIGAFLITGSCIPFHQQSAHLRESVTQGLHKSWLPAIRRVARSLARIAQLSWLLAAPVFRHVTGYPVVPLGWKPGPDFDFRFIQFPARSKAKSDGPGSEKAEPPPSDSAAAAAATIETDVVVVGSGCGGAVCAKVLAEAGHRVVVVDKGYYFPPSMLPMSGSTASRYLFDGSITTSITNSIGVTAGSNWGGGGTVNWSVSLQTQDFVRKDWASQGLDFFDTPDYQGCMDRVCKRMGVATEPVVQSHRGQVLLEGSRKLGWTAGVCPQNSGGAEHSCGHCTTGCGSGEKQGPATCWLPDAAKAGAEFVEGFEVDRILFEDDQNGKRATGVMGRWRSRDGKGGVSGPIEERVTTEVTINAKRVVVACGAVWSPLVLMRSGLTNPNIGRNLHLHPATMVGGFFPEDTRPWEGAIITSYCSEFEDLDGHGHGVKLETMNMTPYTSLSSLPWRSGLDFKLAALRYRHFGAFISVARDRDSGRVFADPTTGDVQIDYNPSAFDRANALEGMLAICKILYVMGASEISPCIHDLEPFIVEADPALGQSKEDEDEDESGEDDKPGASHYCAADRIAADPAFTAWLAKARRLGTVPGNAPFASAHQMGTCRMGVSEDASVVDAQGKVWGVEDLYVADSSVFPSASGVNPMITVMALADWIARAVDMDLRGEAA